MKPTRHSIHHKPPKRIDKKRKRYVSMMTPLVAFNGALAAIQVGSIINQPMPKYKVVTDGIVTEKALKSLEVVTIAMEFYGRTMKIAKLEPRRRFLATGRYER